jgi:hypothetical protein
MTIAAATPLIAKLFTGTEWSQLLKNADPATREHADPVPVVKLFTPHADFVWLLTEINPEDGDTAFGLCDLGMGEPEIGSVSLTEITSHPILPVYKDLNFHSIKTLSELAAEARAARQITV